MLPRDGCDDPAERAPPVARLRADQQDDVLVPIELREPQLVRGPRDPPRPSVDELDLRPDILEVEELFRIDLGQQLRRPDLLQVVYRERRTLTCVVPSAERG